jgi:superoxide dismutase, Fe-Mn family
MFELPKLPYAYDALEPHIDAKTMETHYDKHHRGYTTKLNAALEGHADFVGNKSAEEILMNLETIPAAIRGAVINNGGGYVNHALFWSVLSPNGGGEPTGKLAEAINEAFGSFANFKEKFNNAAATVFGSGWAWLVVDNATKKLEVVATANQNTPLSEGKTPVLALDVWEHAYYLKYQNRRPDYIGAVWNVFNWEEVARRFEEATK